MASGRTPDFEATIARRRIIGEASKSPALIHVPFVLVFDRAEIPRCSHRVVCTLYLTYIHVTFSSAGAELKLGA